MDHQRGSGLLAFLGGAAVGAVVGLLLAPRSGKETRERIMKRAEDARDDLDELIDKAREEWGKASGPAASTATLTKEEVNDLIRFLFEEGKDLAGRIRDDVKTSTDATAERVRHAADHIRHGAN